MSALLADRICAQCHGDMAGRRSDALYCSRLCKSAASDRRRIADSRSKQRDRARYADEAEHRRQYSRDQRAELRSKALAHFGSSCVQCGSAELLELDHLHGNGESHRDQVGHGDAFFRWLLREAFPAECEAGGEYELQILCRSCHVDKTKRERRERR